MRAQPLSHIWHFCDPHQAPLPVEFSRQWCWSGLPFFVSGIFLTQGSNPHLLGLLPWQADSLPLSHLGSPVKFCRNVKFCKNCSQANITVYPSVFLVDSEHLDKVVSFSVSLGPRQITQQRSAHRSKWTIRSRINEPIITWCRPASPNFLCPVPVAGCSSPPLLVPWAVLVWFPRKHPPPPCTRRPRLLLA